MTTKTTLIAVAVAVVVGAAIGFFGHKHFFPCPEYDPNKELELQQKVYELTAERDMALERANSHGDNADSIVYIRDTKTIKQYEKRVTDVSLDSLQSILLTEPRD